MTTSVLPATTAGRHRAPETAEPRWATPADFLAAWRRAGRHVAPPQQDGAEGDADPFDWLGFAPAAS